MGHSTVVVLNIVFSLHLQVCALVHVGLLDYKWPTYSMFRRGVNKKQFSTQSFELHMHFVRNNLCRCLSCGVLYHNQEV